MALWIGGDSQKAAHHFYSLQVMLLQQRLDNFLMRVRIQPTTHLYGILRIKIWRRNILGLSFLIHKASI